MVSEEQTRRAAEARKAYEDNPTPENEQAFRISVEESTGKTRRVAELPLKGAGKADRDLLQMRAETGILDL